MAIKRLEDAGLPEKDRKHADNLIEWFRRNKDGVIRGAWYPDTLIVDNLNSHVLKFKPSGVGEKEEKLRQLPKEYLSATYSAKSTVWGQPFTRADPKDNLPDRCESLTESVVDHLKIQESEEKGSAVSPTDNQVALLLFMLATILPMPTCLSIVTTGNFLRARAYTLIWRKNGMTRLSITMKSIRLMSDSPTIQRGTRY
jgi:hypothetical protein